MPQAKDERQTPKIIEQPQKQKPKGDKKEKGKEVTERKRKEEVKR